MSGEPVQCPAARLDHYPRPPRQKGKGKTAREGGMIQTQACEHQRRRARRRGDEQRVKRGADREGRGETQTGRGGGEHHTRERNHVHPIPRPFDGGRGGNCGTYPYSGGRAGGERRRGPPRARRARRVRERGGWRRRPGKGMRGRAAAAGQRQRRDHHGGSGWPRTAPTLRPSCARLPRNCGSRWPRSARWAGYSGAGPVGLLSGPARPNGWGSTSSTPW